MAPFRPSGRSNRSGRTQIDHDVFEGLPIRQWRLVDTVIDPSTAAIQEAQSKDGWPEPPMPRESNQLPEHSQLLLRAARAGTLYKLPTPPEEEEKEKEGEEGEEPKEARVGFVAKKWSQVPRNVEEPEREYLAKRRKGLPSAYTGSTTNGASSNVPMRETKVKRTDADGSIHVYKVLVPEGHRVEGEIVEEDVEMKEAAPEEATPGTVVEGVGVVNSEGVVVANDLLQSTPPRRRPPPPRRKPKKGPGRGRKKVMFQPGESGTGTASGTEGGEGGEPRIKQEGTPATGEDTPMHEGDEEGEDDGSESEDDRDEGEMSPTPAVANTPKPEDSAAPAPSNDNQDQQQPTPTAATAEQVVPLKRPADALEAEQAELRGQSSSPDLPLASSAQVGASGSGQGSASASRQESRAMETETATPPPAKRAKSRSTSEKADNQAPDQPQGDAQPQETTEGTNGGVGEEKAETSNEPTQDQGVQDVKMEEVEGEQTSVQPPAEAQEPTQAQNEDVAAGEGEGGIKETTETTELPAAPATEPEAPSEPEVATTTEQPPPAEGESEGAENGSAAGQQQQEQASKPEKEGHHDEVDLFGSLEAQLERDSNSRG
ncbi:hypothetical protein HDK90DRAFT_331035 [Phyllosticta capitalensis]|uniref:Lyr family protein n=1 Tax=Phyllosticta capitalensis TaxID=121624 RepID=A0ABR1YJJ1_9PEZI